MIFNGTEEQEKEYLQQVIDIINDTINSTDKSVKEHVDTLQDRKSTRLNSSHSRASRMPSSA